LAKSILTDDMSKCFICGSKPVAWHHVIYGTANRKKADKYGLILPLCPSHHQEVHEGNKILDKKLKAYAQKKFEETYPEERFVQIFGRNYR